MQCRDSLTAAYLRGDKEIPVPAERRPGNGEYLLIRDATENNLKHVDVRLPLGKLICVTGVSGSGKSSLVIEVLYKALAQRMYRAKERPGRHERIEGLENLDKVIDIDQSPIGRTPRSNPATYTNLFTDIRDLFASLPEAKMRGYKPGRFSFNVKGGRCEACQGDGIIRIEMQFLPDVYVPCEVCHGKRYNREALEIKYKGKSIADVLDMTVDEALEFFQNIPRIRTKLQHAGRGGAGLHQAGPAGDDAVGRRGAAGEAEQGAEPARDGQDAVHPGRADDGAALRRRAEAAAGAAAAGGPGQHDRGDRAQPGRDQVGRLDDRPGAGGRRRRAATSSPRARRSRWPRVARSYTGQFLRPIAGRARGPAAGRGDCG